MDKTFFETACKNVLAEKYFSGVLKNPVEKYYKYSVFGDLKNIKDVDENGFFVGNSHKDLKPQISRLFEILDQLNKTIN